MGLSHPSHPDPPFSVVARESECRGQIGEEQRSWFVRERGRVLTRSFWVTGSTSKENGVGERSMIEREDGYGIWRDIPRSSN